MRSEMWMPNEGQLPLVGDATEITPGPWRVACTTSQWYYVIAANGAWVCMLQHLDEVAANVALMTAAPEMRDRLASLEAAVTRLRHADTGLADWEQSELPDPLRGPLGALYPLVPEVSHEQPE